MTFLWGITIGILIGIILMSISAHLYLNKINKKIREQAELEYEVTENILYPLEETRIYYN
jgi:uncharacterized membrane-anchored protein YhcB (DUF1043 family)